MQKYRLTQNNGHPNIEQFQLTLNLYSLLWWRLETV